MSLRTSLGAYNWTEEAAVDPEVVDAIQSEDDFAKSSDETFLFTSPVVRYDYPYILVQPVNSWLVITTKRLFFWKGMWQNIHEMFLTNIHQVDLQSLTRFRGSQVQILDLKTPLFALTVRGVFMDGNNPDNQKHREKRRERMWISKGMLGAANFGQACNTLGVRLGDPAINLD